MRHSYRPDIPPQPPSYRPQVLDHLGLVAGMFEELGITEVIDRAPQQDPEMRIVTVGHAVKALVLNGLGFLNQQLYQGGSTVNRGHEHHRSIRRCSVREGRPRRFGGAQRDSGTGNASSSCIVQLWSVIPAAMAGVVFRV